MNKIKTLALFSLFFALVTLNQSCDEDDPCAGVSCGTYGTCDDGACICDVGYEMNADGACNTLVNAKFVGDYNLSETCSTGSDNYSVSISASTSQNLLNISFDNLYNSTIAIEALIEADGKSFMISSQTFGLGILFGTGSIDTATGIVTINYTVEIGGDSDTCIATLTPQ